MISYNETQTLECRQKKLAFIREKKVLKIFQNAVGDLKWWEVAG
jgi:hypothetical protein